MLDTFLADIRFAMRWLAKSPGFTSVAVLSLAIGIGFNTALFTVVDAVLFRPLPVVEPDRLVDVFTSVPRQTSAQRYGTTSYPDYVDLRSQNAVFGDMIAYSPMFGALSLGERSRLVLGEIVTGNYFQMLGVSAAVGRTLVPDDDRPAAPRVAMVSDRFWKSDLGGGPDVVGRTVKIRGVAFTIVGVSPRWFSGMEPLLAPDLWVSMPAATEVVPVGLRDVVPSPTGTTRLERRGERWLFVRGRLKPGLTIDNAQANLGVVMAQIAAANPTTNKDREIITKATRDVRVHPAVDSVLVPYAAGLGAVVGLVLLIACANVASMLLARATGRQREIAVRLAIGASRSRLVCQLVTESLVLSAIGAVAGGGLAWWLMRTVEAITLPVAVPLAFGLRIDTRALVFTIAATVAAALLAGVLPALKASKPNLVADLKGETLAGGGERRWSLRDALVSGQMALTALLLIVAALLTRSLIAAQQAKVGFEVEHLAAVTLDTGMAGYSDARSRLFWDEALTRVRALPGVESAGLATRLPFAVNVSRWDIFVPGHHTPGDALDTVDETAVSPEYFQTIGVPILQGRAFTGADRPNTQMVAIVNEAMARRFWPGESAVGKTFRTRGADGPEFEIVGVSRDHKVLTVGEAPTPFLHVSRIQRPNSYSSLIARTRGDASALLREMRRELLAVEPSLVFIDSQTMATQMESTLFPVRASAWIVGLVGAIAMLLAAVGLYGIIAYSVTRRTREIGIRIALGADRRSVLTLVMKQGLFVAVSGLAAGCALAAAAARVFAGMLYGVGAGDPVSWMGAAAVLLAVSAVANLLPAIRAARIAPSDALRTD